MPIRARLLALFDRPWKKIVTAVWFLVGGYDLVVSQLLPSSLANKMPRTWDFLVRTSNMISWQTWLVILFGLTTVYTIEYALRSSRKPSSIEPGSRNQLQTWFERDYLELYELAYLSLGKRPHHGGMPDDVLHRHRKLKDAVDSKKLPAKSLNQDGNPNVMTRVHIDDFRKFAKNDGHKDFMHLAEQWIKARGKRGQPQKNAISG